MSNHIHSCIYTGIYSVTPLCRVLIGTTCDKGWPVAFSRCVSARFHWLVGVACHEVCPITFVPGVTPLCRILVGTKCGEIWPITVAHLYSIGIPTLCHVLVGTTCDGVCPNTFVLCVTLLCRILVGTACGEIWPITIVHSTLCRVSCRYCVRRCLANHNSLFIVVQRLQVSYLVGTACDEAWPITIVHTEQCIDSPPPARLPSLSFLTRKVTLAWNPPIIDGGAAVVEHEVSLLSDDPAYGWGSS